MKASTSFGAIALTKNCRRTATVKAETEVEFGIHDNKEDNSIAEIDEANNKKKVHFLKNIQCFNGLSNLKIRKYMLMM